jgi:serine/threonine protein kinase
VLGVGAMGVVYKAWDVEYRRLVALKFLGAAFEADPAAQLWLAAEARLASSLIHRNICTVHGFEVTADRRPFIVLEYCDGVTLQRLLRSGPMPIARALDVATQLADALAYLHHRGITHGDIKPGNVMVPADRIKLLDFGLATARSARPPRPLASPTRGTLAYMAPELFRGEAASSRSDLWALGVVLFEMLAGKKPFPGLYREAISYAVRHEPLPRIRAQAAAVPAAIERIVMRLLDKDPRRRYLSAAAVARDLRALTPTATPANLRPMERMAS